VTSAPRKLRVSSQLFGAVNADKVKVEKGFVHYDESLANLPGNGVEKPTIRAWRQLP
jgi:hypothetical protein